MPADRRLLPRPPLRRGRNEQAVDKVSSAIHKAGAFDDVAHARLTLARTLARSLDRLEDDPDRSEHSIAMVGRVHRDVINDLAGHLGTDDDFAALLAELSAPADPRDTPNT